MPPLQPQTALRIWTTKSVWSCWWVLSLASLLWWDHPLVVITATRDLLGKFWRSWPCDTNNTSTMFQRFFFPWNLSLEGVTSTHPTKKEHLTHWPLSLTIPTPQHLRNLPIVFGFIQFLHRQIFQLQWFGLMVYFATVSLPRVSPLTWLDFLNHLTMRQFSRNVSPKRPLIDKRPSFRCSSFVGGWFFNIKNRCPTWILISLVEL